MNRYSANITRRRAVRMLAGSALLPFVGVLQSSGVGAEDLPRLLKSDPIARALNYVHDARNATRVERLGIPGEEQFCKNCRFIGGESGEWRTCEIFYGNTVNAGGWCQNWSPADNSA